jgi:hypothetical protein
MQQNQIEREVWAWRRYMDRFRRIMNDDKQQQRGPRAIASVTTKEPRDARAKAPE